MKDIGLSSERITAEKSMDINDKLKKRNLNDDNVAKGEVCN
jgi:hypothetical protein